VSFQGSLMAIRELNHLTHFTHYTVAHAHLGAYAFASMVFFGAIYYMMPRLLEREWPSAWLIRAHFWLCGLGIIFYFAGLTLGGWLQGIEMNRKETPFLEIVALTLPYLKSRTWAGSMMTLGHIFFAISFVWMLMSKQSARTTATLLGKPLEATAR
jgi:cytochrome c oxidase cbb3-type subunit 1